MSLCLEVKNLSLNIAEKPIIKDLSFSLPYGKTLAIVGESGAGKSMVAQTIIQCLPKSASISQATSIKLQAQELTDLTEKQLCSIRGQNIGLIFQDAMMALNPVQRIGKQLTETLRLHTRTSSTASKNKIITLLSDVGIKDPESCYNAYPHQLSGGMLQRALIASVLSAEPKLLIADEPTTALDVTVQAKLIKLLASLQHKYNCGLIFISHDLLLVQDIADYVMVMQSGVCLELASAADFFSSPQAKYSKYLLAAAKPPKQTLVAKPASNILEVTSLSVVIKNKTIVNKASFNLQKASTLALIGESGSGKTSLAKAILGIYPSIGQCVWSEELDPKRDLAVVFQNPFSSMNPRLTIAEILTELWHRRKPDNWRELLLAAVATVGLPAASLEKYPHQFSGGERQRLCIARAIIGHPKLIILDEPTSALDVSIQAVIADLLLELQQKYGYSYLLITHDFAVVKKMAHNVAVMQDGSLVEQGNVATVLQQPEHDYTKQLLAAVPGHDFIF